MQNPGELPADEVATQTDNFARSRLKGKEKVREPSEPVSLSHGTPSPRSVVNEPNDAPRDAEEAREPLGAVAPEMLVPPESVLVPSSTGGGAKLRHPDPGSKDPAADLNTRGRHSHKTWYEDEAFHGVDKIPWNSEEEIVKGLESEEVVGFAFSDKEKELGESGADDKRKKRGAGWRQVC
ncbi:hypothetical protein LWI29_002009 [Acer saccharum]|uniref:Uncharacterized protein n=1 Tax=Acer saccharum TaxID=4024 RepID=A0AA39VW01_ACESA|nr:hypothetical protein LWI29_002009 [Acer saccharum]